MEQQFDAFVAGFNELIPPDLVNVFDERELELLIGGIADIDVADWKKHTDYRGYEETSPVIQNFWKVSPRPGGIAALDFHADHQPRFYSALQVGTPNRSRVSCSSQRGLLGYRSMGSRTSREATAREDSRLRIRVRRSICQSHILGMSLTSSPFFDRTNIS